MYGRAIMENIDIIQDSIDYIEENLKEKLSAELLAQRAGFSVFYYYHIFQNFVGLAVSQYIQKRRMLHAVYEI